VKTFFRDEQDSSIKDVYLCDVKDETVDAFTQALVSEFGKSNVQTTGNGNNTTFEVGQQLHSINIYC
jgi:hypothetical protein